MTETLPDRREQQAAASPPLAPLAEGGGPVSPGPGASLGHPPLSGLGAWEVACCGPPSPAGRRSAVRGTTSLGPSPSRACCGARTRKVPAHLRAPRPFLRRLDRRGRRCGLRERDRREALRRRQQHGRNDRRQGPRCWAAGTDSKLRVRAADTDPAGPGEAEASDSERTETDAGVDDRDFWPHDEEELLAKLQGSRCG